jgi:hypothetical protein
VFHFASLRPNAGPLLRKEILLLPSTTSSSHEGANTTDDYVPIVPITNVSQVPEATGEDLVPNRAENVAHNDVQSSAENDESGTIFDEDTEEHSSANSDPGADPHAGGSGASPAASRFPPARGRHARPTSAASPSGSRSPSPHAAHGGHTPPPTPSSPPISPDVSGAPSLSAAGGDPTGSSAASSGGENSVHNSAATTPTSSPPSSPDVSPPRVRTRLQRGIRQPKQFTDSTIHYHVFLHR